MDHICSWMGEHKPIRTQGLKQHGSMFSKENYCKGGCWNDFYLIEFALCKTELSIKTTWLLEVFRFLLLEQCQVSNLSVFFWYVTFAWSACFVPGHIMTAQRQPLAKRPSTPLINPVWLPWGAAEKPSFWPAIPKQSASGSMLHPSHGSAQNASALWCFSQNWWILKNCKV